MKIDGEKKLFSADFLCQNGFIESQNCQEQRRCWNCNELGQLARNCPRTCNECGETFGSDSDLKEDRWYVHENPRDGE